MTPGGSALPKSPFGGPSGPGASPATSAGPGGGNEAAAIADIKSAIPMLTKSISAFPIGDKRRQSLLRAITALEANFGKSDSDALMPAAVQRMGQAAQAGGGLHGHNMPPPGILLPGPQPMPGMGGMPNFGGPPGGGGGDMDAMGA
jgi:hypothetical protein